MAGEYYRWLARDVKPEQKRELTPAEKRRNWWDYHKWYVLIGIVCILAAAAVISDAVTASRNQPDYVITYVGASALPEETREAVELAFAALGEDLNGSGGVRVEIREFQHSGEGASMMLMVHVETAESMIYLLEDPALFAANYPVLTGVDGSAPDSGAPLWYRWGDCPALSGLELGSFEVRTEDGTVQMDSREVMETLCIARRGLWGDDGGELVDGALRLWETLTEGAD